MTSEVVSGIEAGIEAGPDEQQPQPQPTSRPRGRTAALIAAAVLLGVLAGAGVGYGIQAARKPAPLPPLAVAQPQYPKAHRSYPPLTAAEDDMVKTDGDLTKLLVPVPAGGSPWDSPPGNHGWFSLADYSKDFTDPAATRQALTDLHFRRAAVATWQQGQDKFQVVLVQFQHSAGWQPRSWIDGQANFAETDVGGAQYYTKIPDSGITGGVYAGPKQMYNAQGTAYYRAVGLATHGDIAVLIYHSSLSPIASGPLMNLLQNQLERL